MRSESRFGRRGALVLALGAAVVGTAAAAAIPAVAVGSGATPTVTAYPVTNAPTSAPNYLAITPAPSGADWLVVGDDTDNTASAIDDFSNGTVSADTLSGATPGAYAITDGASAFDVLPSAFESLTQSGSTITATDLQSLTAKYPDSVTIGPSGGVVFTENDGFIDTCSLGGSGGCSDVAVPTRFAGGQPDGITTAGGALWFTDDDGDLGELTSGGTFEPSTDSYDTGELNTDLADGILGVGANLYVVTFGGGAIDEISTANPGVVEHTYTPSGSPNISSVTLGADGNLWFADTGNGAVGTLDLTTGAITEYPLPSGDTFATGGGAGNIEPGPAGSDSVVFPLTSASSSDYLVGQIVSSVSLPTNSTTTAATTTTTATTTTQTTASTASTSTPTPATTTTAPEPTITAAKLTLAGTAEVSTGRVAAVKLSCAGATGQTCAGKVTLTISIKVKSGKRIKTVTETLASGRYNLKSGAGETLKLSLSAASYKLVEAASSHTLKVTENAKASSGTSAIAKLSLVGPKPKAGKR